MSAQTTYPIVRMAGRDCVNTGRVVIGRSHVPAAPRELGKEAERLQTALLDERTATRPAAWRRALAPFWRWA